MSSASRISLELLERQAQAQAAAPVPGAGAVVMPPRPGPQSDRLEPMDAWWVVCGSCKMAMSCPGWGGEWRASLGEQLSRI
eukprot:9424133-Pyramimonas_sp.AAC.1